MKPDTKSLRELLLRYVEECERNCVELAPEERASVETWLREDDSARRDAESIAEHLRLLGETRPPAIPNDLSALCLDAIQGRRAIRKHAFRKRWAFAGSIAFAFIFILGIWVGRDMRQSDTISFPQLAKAQSYFIERLETNLAQCYRQDSLREDNPWFQPVQNLKTASQAIAATYEKYSGDPVIERGLSMALIQNINLLKSLCEYIEDNNAIPDRDIQFFDTTQAISDNSI